MDVKEVTPEWKLTHDEAQSEVRRLRIELDEEKSKSDLLQMEVESLTHYIGILKERFFSTQCSFLDVWRSHHWTLFNEKKDGES